MKIQMLGIALVFALIFAVGCGSDDDETAPVSPPASTAPATYTDVKPDEAQELIETKSNLVILDVSPFYDEGHIPGAVNHPMFDGSLEAAIPSLNKNIAYLVYCHSDSVSIAAAVLMIEHGFREVYRLEGNYAAWLDAGYEVEVGEVPMQPAGWTADGIIRPDGEYASSTAFGDDYELYWSADEQFIYIGMKARTDGWVAIGFNPSSRMNDADIVMGFVDDGHTTIMDMISTGPFGPHPTDESEGGSDDILEFAGSESDGYTTIEFKRLRTTGDDKDSEIASGSIDIIWAYGSKDDSSQRHSKRGSGEISLP